MSIQFKDFIPAQAERKVLGFKTMQYKSLQSALEQANDWIRVNRISLINIETIVLPRSLGTLHHSETTEIYQVTISNSNLENTTWIQFIRVWYEG